MKRLPVAIIDTKRLKDSEIIIYSQSFHDGLVAEAVTFPAPPVLVAAFQTLIDNYQAAAVAAVKGTKQDTQNKTDAKTALIQGMKANVTYVNQVVQTTYNTTPSVNYATLRALILSVGLNANDQVKRPNTLGNSRVANTLSSIAKNPGKTAMNVNGVISVRVKAAKKFGSAAIKTYWMQYRTPEVAAIPPATVPIPAGPWIDYVSTSSRINATGITAGLYEYKVAPVIGVFLGKDQLNWSPIQTVIVT